MRYSVVGVLCTLVCSSVFATAAAAACLSDKGSKETATGSLRVEKAHDAMGHPERPYILHLASVICLDTQDPGDKVEASKTLHIYSTDPKVMAAIARMVGKVVTVRGRPFPALTVHHHAPIVMDVSEIAVR